MGAMLRTGSGSHGIQDWNRCAGLVPQVFNVNVDGGAELFTDHFGLIWILCPQQLRAKSADLLFHSYSREMAQVF